MLVKVIKYNPKSIYSDSEFVNNSFNFIENMLLSNKIRLQDIPRKIRVTSRRFYIAALRISRNISVERYNEDKNTLADDIEKIPNSIYKKEIVIYYESIKKYNPIIVK